MFLNLSHKNILISSKVLIKDESWNWSKGETENWNKSLKDFVELYINKICERCDLWI